MQASVNKTDAVYNTLVNIEKKWQALTSEQVNTVHSKEQATLINSSGDKNAGIPVGELLFFSAYLRQYYLGELIAIKSDKGAWLELNSLFEQLNFAIAINNENLTAKGWYISQNNRFELDLTNKTVVIKGELYPLSEQDYYLDAGDIFIDSALLNNWFELNSKLNFSSLELRLSPKQQLPIEQRLQREERKISKNTDSLEPTLPWKASPYQAVSAPVADFQLSYSATKSNSSLNYSILGSQDLAYLKSEYYLAGQNGDDIRDSRLSFSREDTSASLLGPLNATSIEFGDVLSTQIGSNFTSNYARGVKVNNKPLYKKVNSNQINLTGAIQAGWDVELYRNKILIDQQLSLPDGRYLFENIDLLFGTNTFELIFYGPQGQVERKVEEYLIDGNSLNEGEGFYELSLTQEGEQLLTTPNYFNDQQGWLLAGRYEQGVTDYFSVYAGISALKSDNAESQNNYAFGSNLSIFNRVLINLDYEKSNDSEKELELAARTELAGQSVRFSMRKASLLNASQQSNLYNDIDAYELFVSGNVMQNNYGHLSYQNTASHISSDTQQSILRFGNSLNYYNSGYSFNNNLQWSDNDTFFGSSRLQKRFGRLSTRFGVNYEIKPESEVTSYETEFSRNLSSNLQAELKLTHQLEDNIKFVELGLNWQAQLFSLNSNFNYDSEDNWRIGLFGRFSLGYDTKNNNYFVNNRSLVQSGSLMVHVYLDENNNGIYDDGEQNLEGIKVKGLQNYRRAITDEHGIALLSGMPANLTTDIVIEPGSINEPFLVAANDGFSITPRAGFVEYMEIPLNNSSEIEGTVYKQHDGKPSEVQPFATIKLLDQQGKQVAQTQAAYDGYYLFTDLRPGEYKAVIDDEFKERKALKDTQQIMVNLPAQGEVVMGVDFELKEKAKKPAYIANAGRFSSLPIMKAYYQLIKQHLPAASKREAFYIKDKQQKRYILAIAYADSEQGKLEQVCNELQIKGLSCEVQAQLISH
ncbi:carboxypeptidase-like regulatory domain-containing protein [Pseudoalteromonas translucida]|uniref:carboxypeptidase-like regulatory domain-containing protein n=1 Tax=Pseudoalteromonas translucida TaxID=166935 RepID=UPI0012FDCC84|nr:carboxypeptidase-like regulatory domain-containing protein [Pseudoalteromonas translucida]